MQQETQIEIVAETEDGETSVELANSYPLDLVLLDVGIPGIGGIEACRQIKQQHPELPILVLTSRSEKSLITRMIEAGAQGYCLKGIASDSLLLAVRSVAAGASWWDSMATKEIRDAIVRNPPAPSPAKIDQSTATMLENPLTKREQEILALIAAGKSNQEIGEILYIAPGTVRVHVHAILQKLEVRDAPRGLACSGSHSSCCFSNSKTLSSTIVSLTARCVYLNIAQFSR